jgi:DNA-binding CsgD family transcriptional regulator
MVDEAHLRPLERRIRRLVGEGVSTGDIAQRFRRSPDFVRRVIVLSELPNRMAAVRTAAPLRPLERRILRWRDEGADHAEIAPRFHRSPQFVERVEDLARYKLGR